MVSSTPSRGIVRKEAAKPSLTFFRAGTSRPRHLGAFSSLKNSYCSGAACILPAPSRPLRAGGETTGITAGAELDVAPGLGVKVAGSDQNRRRREAAGAAKGGSGKTQRRGTEATSLSRSPAARPGLVSLSAGTSLGQDTTGHLISRPDRSETEKVPGETDNERKMTVTLEKGQGLDCSFELSGFFPCPDGYNRRRMRS